MITALPTPSFTVVSRDRCSPAALMEIIPNFRCFVSNFKQANSLPT